MAATNEIKKKIKVVEAIVKITNAMKLVSASKLKKYSGIFHDLAAYQTTFYEMFANVLAASDLVRNWEQNKKNSKATLWVVFFTSVGLCGAFNSNLIKTLQTQIQPDDAICLVGKKGISLLKSKQLSNQILLDIVLEDKQYTSNLFALLSQQLWDLFTANDKFGKFVVLYTKFVNSLVLEPTFFSLFPLDPKIQAITPSKVVYEFEPDANKVLVNLWTHYLTNVLYGAALESKVCENAARRNVMDSAVKNAQDLIANYKLVYNQKRQAKITQEITEIVAGVEISQ